MRGGGVGCERVADDDVDARVAQAREAFATVLGAQPQLGRTREAEPAADELEERRVRVESELAAARTSRGDVPGERASGGADVDHRERAGGERIDQARHLLHVLEREDGGVVEVDVRARDAVDVHGDGARVVAVDLELDRPRGDVDGPDRQVGALRCQRDVVVST